MNVSNCIICNTPDNLNAEMTVTVDGVQATIKLCDEHAETTTIKQAQTAYAAKLKEIEAFMEQARAMGLEVSMPGAGSGLAVAKSTPTAPRVEQQQDPTIPTLAADEVPLDRYLQIASRSSAKLTSGDGKVSTDMVGMHRADHLLKEAGIEKLEGVVKVETVAGRQGSPIHIPKVQKDQLGVTVINVTPSSDADLQRRFKQLSSQETPTFDEYDRSAGIRCSFCRGEGTIRRTKTETTDCPKCGGTGLL